MDTGVPDYLQHIIDEKKKKDRNIKIGTGVLVVIFLVAITLISKIPDPQSNKGDTKTVAAAPIKTPPSNDGNYHYDANGNQTSHPEAAVTKSDAESSWPVKSSAWDGSVEQVHQYLKDHLNDWDGYQSVEWSKIIRLDNGGYMVRHKYRAKNGFGATMLYNQIFTMDEGGNVTGYSDFN